MARLIGCLFFLVLVMLLACSFPLDSKKFINPIKPPPTSLLVTAYIQAPDFQDPYPLDWPTEFHFYVDDSGKPVNESKVLIDGIVVTDITSGTNPIKFTIDPNSLNDGTHTVRVDMIIDSHSGSLVNQLGGERFEVVTGFDVIVDRTLPALEPPRAAFENGYLTVRWGTPSKKNLNFRILNYRFVNLALVPVRTNNFSAHTPSLLIDSGYVGGSSLYQVSVSNFARTQFVGSVNVNRSPATFAYTINPDRSSKLTWTAPIANDAVFTLVGNSGSHTLPLSDGSIACDSFYLGDQKSYHLLVQRTGFASQAYDSVFTISTKASTRPFSQVRMLPQQSRMLMMTSSNVYRINLPDFIREDSISSHLYMATQPAQLITSADASRASFVFSPSFPVLFGPLDFSQNDYYPVWINDPVQGQVGVIPTRQSAFSSNGLLGVSFNFNGSPTAGIIDVTKDPTHYPSLQLVWKDSANASLPSVSDNGAYAAITAADGSSGRVFQNNGGSWNLTGQVAAGDLYFGSNSTDLISIGQSVKIYDISSATGGNGFYPTSRTFDYAARFAGVTINHVGFDAATQDLYVETIDPYYYSTISIFDGVSFALKGTAKAFVRPTAETVPTHSYSNHYHFLSTGYWEKIK